MKRPIPFFTHICVRLHMYDITIDSDKFYVGVSGRFVGKLRANLKGAANAKR